MELEGILGEGFGSIVEAPETEPGTLIEMNAKGFKNIVTQPPESQNVTGKGFTKMAGGRLL